MSCLIRKLGPRCSPIFKERFEKRASATVICYLSPGESPRCVQR
jgi:hypothetical protein